MLTHVSKALSMECFYFFLIVDGFQRLQQLPATEKVSSGSTPMIKFERFKISECKFCLKMCRPFFVRCGNTLGTAVQIFLLFDLFCSTTSSTTVFSIEFYFLLANFLTSFCSNMSLLAYICGCTDRVCLQLIHCFWLIS